MITHRDCQLQPPTQRFHLPPKFFQQSSEIGCVFELRKLPVHIDAIEDARFKDVRCEMTAQKGIYA